MKLRKHELMMIAGVYLGIGLINFIFTMHENGWPELGNSWYHIIFNWTLNIVAWPIQLISSIL